ncbi:MAG: dephospho-CoA kinase [Rhizobiales bacterium]|nr:dephospho-CoA kinase [Hyphomicrobiales bacterium]
MIVIGLTGGIAMGKSEVAKVFAAEGIPVFDSDREVHRLYDSDEGAALLAPLAPAAIADGKVDRKRLSALVLADPALLNRLEGLVHAEIRRRRELFLAAARAQGAEMAVLDVPLLFETGSERDCDVTVVVSAGEDIQRRRALSRPGMTEEKLAMVLKRQLPDSEKRARADHLIETTGTLEQLRSRVLAVIAQIRNEKRS